MDRFQRVYPIFFLLLLLSLPSPAVSQAPASTPLPGTALPTPQLNVQPEKPQLTYTDSVFLRAKELFEKRKWNEAILLWKQVKNIDTTYPYVYYYLGLAYANTEKFKDAERSFLHHISQYPQNALGYYNYGLSLAYQKNMPGAIEAFRKAAKLDSSLYQAWQNMGLAFIEQRKVSEAYSAFSHAVRANPSYAPAQYYLAVTSHQLKKDEEALAALKKTIRLDSTMPGAYYLLGEI